MAEENIFYKLEKILKEALLELDNLKKEQYNSEILLLNQRLLLIEKSLERIKEAII